MEWSTISLLVLSTLSKGYAWDIQAIKEEIYRMPENLAEQMQQLYRQFGNIAGITIELHKELLAIKVENQAASALIFLQGAQLVHYQPVDDKPVIWCSPLCDYREGTPLRGGIPICWPWFGDLTKNPDPVQSSIDATSSVQAHGFVRNRPWQLTNVEAVNPTLTRINFSLQLETQQEKLWPYATSLELQYTIGETLSLQCDITNNDAQAVSFSGALHSYFSVSEIDQIAVQGIDGLIYIDCLDDWNPYQQQQSLLINREIDRIYHGKTDDISIIDKNYQRVINISSEGSNSAVIWNPWQDKAKRLSHFAEDAFREMLCIETANADKDYKTLQSGESHQLGVTISSTRITTSH